MQPEVRGIAVDEHTRCVHWNGPLDVVAFHFACCDGWWACQECHAGLAGHDAQRWPRSRFADPSVRCGVCATALTVPEYVACGSRCPACGAGFNPGCKAHWADYFDV